MKKDIELLTSGALEVLPFDELERKLLQKRPLIIKLGADPTAPNIHLGHIVVLEKLHDFQKMGHKIMFLIGDFTARIGDPTGKSKTRPSLEKEEISKNVKTYSQQIGRVLDMSKVDIVYNADWFDTFSAKDFLKLTGMVTVSQIIERDDFSKRLNEGIPIGLHELLYPLLQGYDSVVLHADIEIGGTDQKFNMLMGRHLQSMYGFEPQVVITMPIIEGTDGVQKMSKSLKNDISLMDSAKDAFLKIMAIADNLIVKYYKIFFKLENSEIEKIIATLGVIEAKKKLAFDIIQKYWSDDDAFLACQYFTEIVQKKNYSTDLVQSINLDKSVSYKIIDVVALCDSTLSRSQIRRLIYSGSVYLGNEKIIMETKEINVCCACGLILKVGKRKIFTLNFD